MTQLLDGKTISQQIKDQVKKEITTAGAKPGIAVILVGNDPASINYVENKTKACQEVGIHSTLFVFEETVNEATLHTTIKKLNADTAINGILLQLPLPGILHDNEQQILEAISPEKDIDGLHPINIGRFMNHKYLKDTTVLLPCTPYGVIKILEAYNIPVAGTHAVVIGRSNLVGKPLGMLLLAENSTVTFCHSQTKNLKEITKQADILVSAVGIPQFINSSFVKKGAVVIDVGFNYEHAKVVGDVNFTDVVNHASAITPVPGGIGPMTVAILMENVWKAYGKQHKN